MPHRRRLFDDLLTDKKARGENFYKNIGAVGSY